MKSKLTRMVLSGCLILAIAVPALAQEAGIDNQSRATYLNSLKGKKVIFIPMTMSVDLTQAWNTMMQHQAQLLGYTVEVRDADWDTEAGAQALTAAIAAKPDLIVLQNPDVQSYARLIKKAAAAGVKVMQLNMQSLVPSDAYVGADWEQIGEDAGEEVANRCSAGKGPSTKVAIVMAVPTGPSDLYQVYGFRHALASHPEIQIVSQQAADYDPSKAHSITASVLQQHPDLCATFGMWDSMDAGTGAAVKEAGKAGKVFVVTSGGGSQASCDKVKQGIFSMMITYDVRLQGAAINEQIAELLQSKLPANANPVTYYTPLKEITAANLTSASCWTTQDLQ